MSRFNVNPDISRAQTLHTDFYTDPAVFELAKEKLFSGCWQFIGDVGMVNEPGRCYPFMLLENYLDEPLLLTRDQQNNLHCISNVCTHRGTLVIKEPCKAAHLRCRYHGRQFGLDGRYISMPEFKEVKDFPTADDDLKQLPLFNWGPLLFVSLQGVLPPQLYLQ